MSGSAAIRAMRPKTEPLSAPVVIPDLMVGPLESALKLVARAVPAEQLALMAAREPDVAVAKLLYRHVLGREDADNVYVTAIHEQAAPEVFAEADAMFGVDVHDVDDALLAATGSPHEVVFEAAFNRLVSRVKEPEELLKEVAVLNQPRRFEQLIAVLEPHLTDAYFIVQNAQLGKNAEMIALAEALKVRVDARENA